MGNPLNQPHKLSVDPDHEFYLNPIWAEAVLEGGSLLIAFLSFSNLSQTFIL